MEARKLIYGAVVIALTLGAFAAERKMRGHLEYQEKFSTRNAGDELYFEIDKVGLEHTLEIRTSDKTSLQFVLLNPDGVEVLSDTELTSHSGKRLHHFTPYEEGEWTLSIGPRALSKSGRLAGTVSILTGDKRPFSCRM